MIRYRLRDDILALACLPLMALVEILPVRVSYRDKIVRRVMGATRGELGRLSPSWHWKQVRGALIRVAILMLISVPAALLIAMRVDLLAGMLVALLTGCVAAARLHIRYRHRVLWALRSPRHIGSGNPTEGRTS